MRRMVFALTGLVLALAASAPAGPRAPAPVQVAAVTATTFVASGRGWGHGVGMSQYGALGFANEGWTYDRILGHYYLGATLGPAPVARVRVLVAEARPSVKVRSQAPFRVRDVFGATYALPAGEIALGPQLRITVNGTPTALAGPIALLPGTAPLELDRAYRGQLEIAVTGTKLNAINVVGLEQYLAGVVAQEMPSSWPEEALKAQAVAARSYALSRRLTGKGFDLYADVRSQVYGGIRGEQPSTTAAVEATKGEVLLWEGKPIDALFHSTSGGAHDRRCGGVRKGRAVPRRGRRSLQRALAGASLGAGSCRRGGDPQGPEAAHPAHRARAHAGPLRAGDERRAPLRRRVGDGDGCGAPLRFRAPLDLDHAARHALAHASRRARRLREDGGAAGEGRRHPGGRARAARRRCLDEARGPGRRAGGHGEADGADDASGSPRARSQGRRCECLSPRA